jgi:hypothetical protein
LRSAIRASSSHAEGSNKEPLGGKLKGSFKVSGRTGTVGAKDVVLDPSNGARALDLKHQKKQRQGKASLYYHEERQTGDAVRMNKILQILIP